MKRGRAHRKAPEAPFYNRVFRVYEHFSLPYSKSRYFPVWKELVGEIAPDAKILEIGCGTGQLAAYLYDQGFRHYHGFDFSKSAVLRARKAAPEFDFVIADARNPKAYAVDYDTVVTTEVLEHLDNDRAIFGRLNPGTRVHFTVPTKDDKSHVRFFPTAKGVSHRYDPYLDGLSVRTLRKWHIGVGSVK